MAFLETSILGCILARICQHSLLNDKRSVKDIMPKNGSSKLKNISSADSKQYCLSLDTPQPFSRGSLCIWRPWKHRDKGACLILILIYHTTCLYWNSHCGKTACYIWKVLRQQILNNIAFYLMPSSHSAAADCAYGVLGNIDIRMHSCATMQTQPQMTSIQLKT